MGNGVSEKYTPPTDTGATTGNSFSKDLPLPPREGEGVGADRGRYAPNGG